MSDIMRVKEATDIVSFIQGYVPSLKKAGRYYKALCPFHAEKSASFVVDPETQQWRCYGACATGGDVYAFAMKREGWTFAEALTELAKRARIQLSLPTGQQRAARETEERLLGLLKTAAEIFHQQLYMSTPASASALRYTRERRGLTDQTLAQFQIGYAPDEWHWLRDEMVHLGYAEKDLIDAGLVSVSEKGHTFDRFRHRLMFPIRDDKGYVRGFGARALHLDDDPKYLNSPQSPVFDKGHLLYGLDRARHAVSDAGNIVVVEGYMDVVQAHQAGYVNVVAQMGTALTEAQLERLGGRYTKKIILALDPDSAGQNAMLRVSRDALESGTAARLGVDLRAMQLPAGKDPDDVLREDPHSWGEAVSKARPIVDILIAHETVNITPHSTIQEKEAAARRLLPLLSASGNSLYTDDNIQKLAARLTLPSTELKAWLQPQLKILKPASPSPSRATLPPADLGLEMSILHCVMVNDDERWLDQVNEALGALAPDLAKSTLAPLDPDDFAHQACRELMTLINQAVEMDQRPVYVEVEEAVQDSPLQETYERVVYLPITDSLFRGDASAVRHDSYEDLISRVYRLRLIRVQHDMAAIAELGDDVSVALWMDCYRATGYLKTALQDLFPVPYVAGK